MLKTSIRFFQELFDDRWTFTAGVILVLIISVVVFNLFVDFTLEHPLLSVLIFSLVPVLFIIGGIVFTVAIFRLLKQQIDES